MKWLAVLAGACCLSFSAAASAEPADSPCTADAATLCKDVQKGKGALAKCLKEHESELSPACKDGMAKMKQRVQDMKEACKDDAQKLCKDIQVGRGRIMQCLKQHEDELSAACKEKMTRSKERK